jgi:RNA polymerase sigma-70 factor (ECF subfamily)
MRLGDMAAFEALFRAYGNALSGLVYRYLGSADEASELVQDLFAWIWEHRHEWQVRTGVRAYLLQAARNRAKNRLRQRAKEEQFRERSAAQVGPDVTRRSPWEADHTLYESELAEACDRAIAELSERCRQVFLLNRQQQLSYTQIATVLGISPKTVEIHMGRALASLRESLAEWLR